MGLVELPGEGLVHLGGSGLGNLFILQLHLVLYHFLDQVLDVLLGGRGLIVKFHVSSLCSCCCEGFLVEFLESQRSVIAGKLVGILLDGGSKYFDSQVSKAIQILDGWLLL